VRLEGVIVAFRRVLGFVYPLPRGTSSAMGPRVSRHSKIHLGQSAGDWLQTIELGIAVKAARRQDGQRISSQRRTFLLGNKPMYEAAESILESIQVLSLL